MEAKSKVVDVAFRVSNSECLALAQFVKRVTWYEIRDCAVDDDEARTMAEAFEQLRVGLARAGFAPR